MITKIVVYLGTKGTYLVVGCLVLLIEDDIWALGALRAKERAKVSAASGVVSGNSDAGVS